MGRSVFLVNGYPGSGKDEFATILSRYVPVVKYSIIDEVKRIAETVGWKGEKTPAARRFLCDLKALLGSYNDLPLRSVKTCISLYREDSIQGLSSEFLGLTSVLLIDVRESGDLRELVITTQAETIFIDRPSAQGPQSNFADALVRNWDYDYTIPNTGTLEDFEDHIVNWGKKAIPGFIGRKLTTPCFVHPKVHISY